jgi:multicomponent Na+:H+ antiporter subunit B
MRSLILSMAMRFLLPLLILFSLFLLLRGHDRPGGGFSGGLVLASALSLFALAQSGPELRRLIPFDPIKMMATGLLLAVGSGCIALLGGGEYLEGLFLPFKLPALGGIALGTPILFDIGVYFVAMGSVAAAYLALEEA